MIITIDGPAASGKGTLARRLAEILNLAHLDTGALYRAVGLAMLRGGLDVHDESAATRAASALDVKLLCDADLRTEDTGAAASAVAKHPGVRAALLNFQRDFAANPPDGKEGAILDGRDTGSVICPDADVKFYVEASVAERARRRAAELSAAGKQADVARIEADIAARDAQDKARAEAPLVLPDGAHLLDTTQMRIEAALAAALDVISRATPA